MKRQPTVLDFLPSRNDQKMVSCGLAACMSTNTNIMVYISLDSVSIDDGISSESESDSEDCEAFSQTSAISLEPTSCQSGNIGSSANHY